MKVRDYVSFDDKVKKSSNMSALSHEDETIYWNGNILASGNGYRITKHRIGGRFNMGSSSHIEEYTQYFCWWKNKKTFFQITESRDNEIQFNEPDEYLMDIVIRNNVRNGVRITVPLMIEDGGEWGIEGWNLIITCLKEPSTPAATKYFADRLDMLTFAIYQPKMEWAKMKFRNGSHKAGRSEFFNYNQEISMLADLNEISRQRAEAKQ